MSYQTKSNTVGAFLEVAHLTIENNQRAVEVVKTGDMPQIIALANSWGLEIDDRDANELYTAYTNAMRDGYDVDTTVRFIS